MSAAASSSAHGAALRIVVVEDHTLFRELFCRACAATKGCRMVGSAGCGRDVPDLIAKHQPDLLFLDLNLPDIDGIEVAKLARVQSPGIKIIIVSAHCNEFTFHQVEQLHVDGFIDKNLQSPKSVETAIAAVRAGRTFFSKSYLDARSARTSNPHHFTKYLTEREISVLRLIGRYMNDDDIAATLGIAPSTVQTHRSNLLRKLNLPNSTKLLQFAQERGFSL
jgi:DNA-binding NarL/FixJ family response regulator